MVYSWLTLKYGENCERGYATKGGCVPAGGGGVDSAALVVDAAADVDFEVLAGGGVTDNDTPPVCRGRSWRASSAPRPYMMSSSAPCAALGAGKAVTSGKSASAAAQGMETFICYIRTR